MSFEDWPSKMEPHDYGHPFSCTCDICSFSRTPLGKQLRLLRAKAIERGLPLKTLDEIERELRR